MLNINLLPEESRKIDQTSLQQFHRTPFMWIVAGMMVTSLLGLMGIVSLRRIQAQKITSELESLQPKKLVIDQLQKFVKGLQDEQLAFERLRGKETAWAKRLTVLADIVPEGIWFTNLVWDPTEGLRLEGVAIQEDGAEMSKLSRFIETLKTHPSFGPELTEVKIDSVQRMQDESIEMVKFTITGKVMPGKS